MAKYKVLRIINRLNLGGPTFNAGLLTRYLHDDFETVLIAGMKDASEAESDFILDDLGISATKLPNMHRSLHPVKDLKALIALIKIIRKEKPDIIHTHASKAGFLGRLAGWLCGVKVMVHTFHGHVFHSYFGKLKTGIFLFLERFLARKSSSIIAISPIQKKELVEDFRITTDSKMKVVPLGFDLNKFTLNKEEKRKAFRAKYGIGLDTIVITIVGRLVPIKNHNFFFEAIAELKKRTNKKFTALVVGDGESKLELIEKVKDLNLDFIESQNETREAEVVFTSWIKEIDVVNAASDICTLTSDNEGTPVSLIEAQASGVPIVSTNVGGIADILEVGIGGELVEKGDLKSFTDLLEKWVNQTEERERYKNASVESVLERFSYNRLCADIEHLYRADLRNIS